MSFSENNMKSAAQQARLDKAKRKSEPVCTCSCIVYVTDPQIGTKNNYTIRAVTEERLLMQQKAHSASHPKKIVTFSKISKI